jgi:hypothetical protein
VMAWEVVVADLIRASATVAGQLVRLDYMVDRLIPVNLEHIESDFVVSSFAYEQAVAFEIEVDCPETERIWAAL